mgnify:CR=1 FL=1
MFTSNSSIRNPQNSFAHKLFSSTNLVLALVLFLALSAGIFGTPGLVKADDEQIAAPASAEQANPLDSEEQSFIQLINDYRKANGLGELVYQPQMEDAAKWMSQDMAEKNYFSHTDSLGRNPFDRMADFGYEGGWMGENLAAGRDLAQDAFNQFKNSPGHNANMLKAPYTKIGVSRYFVADSTYGWYWTVDFSD